MEQVKKKIAFIINPKSGTSKKHNLPELIQESIDPVKYQITVLFTKCAGHATELARHLSTEGYDVVFAAGGDGTVNEVGRGLIGTGVPMGIIPCGSGNGLARFLNIPLKIKEAVALVDHAQEKLIDYGIINDHPFFCTCGVGFDAHIGNRFAHSTKRGFFTYVKETISAFFYYKPKKYKVKVDGEKLKTRAFLITVANAGQYGNDAYIAPQADISDGLLDLCILTPFPKIKAFHLGIRLFNRTMDQCSYIMVRKGQNIVIKRKKEGEVHIDGEPAIMGKKLNIHIVDSGLTVMVPGNHE